MGQDYNFHDGVFPNTDSPNGDSLRALSLLIGFVYTYSNDNEVNIPFHPAADDYDAEGEKYRARTLYEYAETIIRIISALPEYNRATPQKVNCWGDPVGYTLSDADRVSSRGLRADSPEMKAWAKEQDWYLPAALNSVVTNMTILGNYCRRAGLDSVVILD